MQKIERYGVIALLFLIVTIIAVTYWNDEPKVPAGNELAQNPPQKQAETPARPTNVTPGAARANELANRRPNPQGQRSQPGAPLDRTGDGTATADPRTQRPIGGGAAQEPETTGLLAFETNRTNVPQNPPQAQQQQPQQQQPQPRVEPAPTIQPVQPPKPVVSTPREVTVQSGDTLARIALRHLGDESQWQAIADFNGISDPKRLQTGQKLLLPTAGSSTVKAPASTVKEAVASTTGVKRPTPVSGKSRLYTVPRGDVLSTIAQRECGSVRAVPAITALNPGLVPDRVVVGQELLLPVGEGFAPAPAASPAGRVASSNRDEVASNATGTRRNVVH